MKRIAYTIILLLLVLSATKAQDLPWFVKSSEAKSYASSHQLPILLVFAGSDWCKPCMQLKNTILKSTEFEAYFPGKFALLYLDFPMAEKNKLSAELTKQNELLAEKYNKSGFFPNMILIETTGKIIGTLNFKNQSPKQFIKECEALL